MFEHALKLLNLIGHGVVMEGNRKMTGCLQTFGGHCICVVWYNFKDESIHFHNKYECTNMYIIQIINLMRSIQRTAMYIETRNIFRALTVPSYLRHATVYVEMVLQHIK